MAEQDKQVKGADDATREKAGIAKVSENDKLEHSVGGKTTRSDAHDLGVPMLAGDPGERQGPEDALGAGPKRGDYRERQDGSQHVEVVANPKAGELILDDDGNTVDVEPASIPVVQNPRVEEIGEEPGLKGGVETGTA